MWGGGGGEKSGFVAVSGPSVVLAFTCIIGDETRELRYNAIKTKFPEQKLINASKCFFFLVIKKKKSYKLK